jgi:hypothetical protein
MKPSMKPLLPLLLLVSLAINAALAALLFADRAEASAAAQKEAAAFNASPPRAKTAPRIDPATWAALQTDDLPALATRLRETGFPKEMVRAILTGVIAEQFSARRRALDPADAQRPYWKEQPPDARLGIARARLHQEQAEALRTVLGVDALPTDPLSLARLRMRFGNLAPATLSIAQSLVADYEQKRTELFYASGTITAADNKRLDGDLRAALAGVLSPAELGDYDLRNSNTGRSLRNELATFKPTEEEFRAIYQLRKAFDEEFVWGSTIPSQEEMRRRTEAEKLMLAQIKLRLPPDRAAEYERSTNYEYRRTAQLVARLELPPETTVKLWNIQQDFSARRTEILRQPNPVEARNQLLSALQQKAIAQVAPVLGSTSRVEAYKQYGGGWITTFVPPPSPRR